MDNFMSREEFEEYIKNYAVTLGLKDKEQLKVILETSAKLSKVVIDQFLTTMAKLTSTIPREVVKSLNEGKITAEEVGVFIFEICFSYTQTLVLNTSSNIQQGSTEELQNKANTIIHDIKSKFFNKEG